MNRNEQVEIPHSDELDFSAALPDDFEALSRDVVPVRSMRAGDLEAVVRIDRHCLGMERRHYYERKFSEALDETNIRISLAAEVDGTVVGFLMANVDYGEFGIADREAVIHSIGVDPAFSGRHVGKALMSQLLMNLHGLGVERVVTEIDWRNPQLTALLAFLKIGGFRPGARLSLSRTV